MCMFTGEVLHVAKTRIFVGPAAEPGWQVIVYANVVNADRPVAMILPCPAGGPVTLHDVSKQGDLFDRLETAIFNPPTLGATT